MNPGVLATVIAVLAQIAAPVVPGFGRPWFERARAQPRVHMIKTTTATKHLESRRVVCNMPVVRPSADVDPKIVVEPPKGVGFTLRTIDGGCK